RRFHAQPNACPRCGPRLQLVDRRGNALPGDPIVVTAELLRAGQIVAVKGLGGFHLACDATNAAAVSTLRLRKHRDAKPFAVMVRRLSDAEALAVLTATDRQLLESVSRPIVLVPRRSASALAADVAPENPLVGLMLPYTPLHELLLAAVDGPLVMTSGNHSDEPMVIDNAGALHHLGAIADAILQHDRDIANRCDDSVVRVLAGKPAVLRRGRGWIPGNLRVTPSFPVPILACGAHLKSSFCLGVGDQIWLGPHVGDLETDEACRAFEAMVDRFARFVGVEPQAVVHDLHPDYFTTRWAGELDLPMRIAVQHHHAHVASVMAEHQLSGPVIGLAWDGTGYGTDGTAWGGEFLLAHLAGFQRLATFHPIPLAGGDQAIREIWRIALALLDDAFDGDAPLAQLSLFDLVESSHIAVARRMIATRLHAPLAHGVGRYFDAFGAILLGVATARYEGEVAMQLSLAGDAAEQRPYAFGIAEGVFPAIDLRPTLRAAVNDLLSGISAATIAARFHATLREAAFTMIERIESSHDALPIVLSGGCFQNARLVEDLKTALRPRAVYLNEHVPPNDGGIALGQAMIAAAQLRSGTLPCCRTTSGGM
ncbi:MAG: carbamoyltransferase HypF, partial [Deltaproteobacteria bacterium]|nr:carbamoyltransferase HypF [Deltaproteobacteria bacterium]